VNIAKERMSKIHPYAKAVTWKRIQDFSRFYPKNTMICSEAERATELYIIRRGHPVSKRSWTTRKCCWPAEAGDIFGEMALLENKPRSASGIAHED